MVWLIVQWGFGLLLAAMFAIPLLSGGDPRNLSSRALMGMAGAAGAVVCARGLWRLRTPYAVFRDDSVERRGFLGWRRLARRDIEGVGAIVSNRNGAYFMIYPKSGSGGPIQFPASLRKDPVVQRWLAGALDPRAEAIKADRAAVLADPLYGATETERAARLAIARKAMNGFTLICVAGAVWLGFFGSLSPALTILSAAVALVGAAIVVASKGLIVWAPGGRARPTAVGALAPLLALIARAAFTVHLHDAAPLLIGGAVAGVAAAAILTVRPRAALGGARAAAGVGIFAGVAAFGAAVLVDVAFDPAAPVTYPTIVADERIHNGRSTSYTLDLAPVQGRPAESVSVGADFYRRMPVGALVCVAEHPGAMATPWFEVEDCPADTPMPVVAPDA